jgi:two-component system OmpR family response regulator
VRRMTHAPQRLRVLVVDDDDAIRELLEELLTRDGFDVTALADPTQVEAAARAQRFHLALLDLMMPRQDGIETLRRLRLADRDVAVIIVTGYPSLDTAVDAMKLEAMDYLRKPFSVEELRAVIERTLRKKGLTRAPEEQLLRAVGDAVRRLRHERGLTLKQLAERAGLSISQISQVERAESSPSVSSLYRLAVALESRVQDLFGDF